MKDFRKLGSLSSHPWRVSKSILADFSRSRDIYSLQELFENLVKGWICYLIFALLEENTRLKSISNDNFLMKTCFTP